MIFVISIQVVCGKCSSKKSNLAYDNNRPNRVCDKCFSILKNVDGKEVDQKAPKGVKKVSVKGQQISSKVRLGEKLISSQSYCTMKYIQTKDQTKILVFIWITRWLCKKWTFKEPGCFNCLYRWMPTTPPSCLDIFWRAWTKERPGISDGSLSPRSLPCMNSRPTMWVLGTPRKSFISWWFLVVQKKINEQMLTLKFKRFASSTVFWQMFIDTCTVYA